MDWNRLAARLLVTNFCKSYDFFTKMIGLEIHWGERDDSFVSFAVPGSKHPCLAIFKAEEQTAYKGYVPPERTGPADQVVLVIPTDCVDDDYGALLKKGVIFMGEPQTIPEWYMRCVYFRDPDGNLFELCQELDLG